MITVTNNSVQQINAALLAMLREIEQLKKQNKELSDKINSSSEELKDEFDSNINDIDNNIDNIENNVEVCMQPRVGGTGSTLASLETSIVNGTHATACCGSQQITDGPDGNNWYNFVYIPHRTGIDGDNYQYGSLLLFNMTSDTNNMWICHLISGTWYSPQRINS